MIIYLIKSTLCLLVLWAFYKLFLEKEKIHLVKRYYLLASLVLAYTIPLITFTYQKEVFIQPEVLSTEFVMDTTVPEAIFPVMPPQHQSLPVLPIVLWMLYGVGVVLFGIRFVIHLIQLRKRVLTNERLEEPPYTNVLLSDAVVPHSFLSYIFVSKNEFAEQQIPKEVLLHEQAHVDQKHTLDILFVEVMQVIFWFNPLLFMLKKDIKLNHEFLADHTVLKQKFSIKRYVDLLVNYPNSLNQAGLTSTINYSLTKKRLQMMTSKFSTKRVILKLIAMIPVVMLCLLFLNNQIIAQEKNVWKPADTNKIEDKTVEIKIVKEQIYLNGSPVALKDFANSLNKLIKDWTPEEVRKANFNIVLQNTDPKFEDQVNKAYQTTRLSKEGVKKELLVLPNDAAVKRKKAGRIVKKPNPPQVPQDPSISKPSIQELEASIERTIEEIGDAVGEEIEAVLDEVEVIEEIAEREAEMAAQIAEQAAIEAEKVIASIDEDKIANIAHDAAKIAEYHAKRASKRALEAVSRALKHANRRASVEQLREKATAEALKAREYARLAAERARAEAKRDRDKYHYHQHKSRMDHRQFKDKKMRDKYKKEMQKIEKENRKNIEKARKKRNQATQKLREAERKAEEKRRKALQKLTRV